MKQIHPKPEIIAPAGDLNKLKIAFQYGADAVYASTPKFSMRTRDIGFTPETLKEGIEYTHKIGKKIYLTLNVFPHPSEIEDILEHARLTAELGPDAIIAADPGIVNYLLKNFKIPVHLSTQANTTNQLTTKFWKEQGVERVVLARELSLKDIKILTDACPIPVESFVHGSMCMAYSGRCQISNYLVGRDPNCGACIQACRFKYKFCGVQEESRPNEVFPIYEDNSGSYLFNSKDLCMIEYIPELVEAGISSFKIEGRLKSTYYVGTVVRAYRQALDLYYADPEGYLASRDAFRLELNKVANRKFTTGFYFQKPNEETNNYETARPTSDYGYLAMITSFDKERMMARAIGKNRLKRGSEIEIVTPDKIIVQTLEKIIYRGEEVEESHAGYDIEIPVLEDVPENSFIRSKVK